MTFTYVLKEIANERSRQDKKWGEHNHPDLYWLGILMEEVGESAKACIEDTPPGAVSNLREELVQVAAVCVAWAEAMDRREPKT